LDVGLLFSGADMQIDALSRQYHFPNNTNLNAKGLQKKQRPRRKR
jgi:hypothetical protein